MVWDFESKSCLDVGGSPDCWLLVVLWEALLEVDFDWDTLSAVIWSALQRLDTFLCSILRAVLCSAQSFGCMLAEAETEDWEDGVSLSLSNVWFADLQSCHQNTLSLISIWPRNKDSQPDSSRWWGVYKTYLQIPPLFLVVCFNCTKCSHGLTFLTDWLKIWFSPHFSLYCTCTFIHILLPWWTASIVLFKCDVHLYICGFFPENQFLRLVAITSFRPCNIMPSVASFVSKSYLTLSQFLLVWFPNPLAAARQMGGPLAGFFQLTFLWKKVSWEAWLYLLILI